MPAINRAVEFSDDAILLINKVKGLPDFNHNHWQIVELEPVRAEIRNFYRTEQRLVCVFCLNTITNRSALGANIEHVAPKSLYPQFMFEPKNLCVICPDCNEYKNNREVFVEPATNTKNKIKYPIKSEDFVIYQPHFDDYSDHIIRSGHIYVDRTLKGSYTIFVCNLNRFFHRFGVCEEYLNDLEGIKQSEDFHNHN